MTARHAALMARLDAELEERHLQHLHPASTLAEAIERARAKAGQS